MKEYSDIELIKIVQNSNSEEAFSELFDRYSVKVKKFCINMIDSRDQAEDIFQETFIAFYNNIINGKNLSNPGIYLFAIARNLCYKFYRDRKNMVEITSDIISSDDREKYENNELLEFIYKGIQLLEIKHRECFVLRELNGLSYSEISKLTGLSESGVKSRYRRAFIKLREIMSPYINEINKNY